MNNIWGKLHDLQDDEMKPNLRDYSAVSSNDQGVQTLKEGLKNALRLINNLNMAPNTSIVAKQKVWFEKPWITELADKQSFVFTASAKLVRGEMEVLREDLQQVDAELQH